MRAKLKVESVLKTEFGEEVKFQASYSDTKEDNSFSKATPVADLKMSITNPELFGTLVPGDKYFLDFTKAE